MTTDLLGSILEPRWYQIIPGATDSQLALRNLTVATSAVDKARYSSSPASHSKFAVGIVFTLSEMLWPLRPLNEIILNLVSSFF
jgi:hypothetical protein